MKTFIVTNRHNALLAADVGPSVARLIEKARPGWIVTDASDLLASERRHVIKRLKRNPEIPGVKYQGRVIPMRPVKPTVERIATPYGNAVVLSRHDGEVKFQTADGRVYQLPEAA